MTPTLKRTPADVLRESRSNTSKSKRNSVFLAVDTMRREGRPITFAAVAQLARVSRWLVYADGVRDYIEAAQAAEEAIQAGEAQVTRGASAASIRTDLELQRQENKLLRADVERLKRALREQLGDQLEAESSQSLRIRLQELTTANIRTESENVRLANELAVLQTKLSTAEDDLAAARTSLRRMIRNQSKSGA